ncbi:hypothetical protein DL96DRAFT_1716088 [Flagelloscypha sp. PMI_526]|nr:hypothetical protein DL96DRAFT_1716088 [Flagelloscypha sp. PMI_526]
MTPDENATLSFLGERVLVHMAQATVAFTMYGAYLLVFIVSARILLRPSNTHARTRILLALSTLLLASMTLRFASWCSFLVIQMKGLFVNGSLPLGQRRPGVKARLTKFDIILYFGRSINLIVSDLIAIWRAWVLYRLWGWSRATMAVVSILNAAGLDAAIGAGSNKISSHTFAVVISTSSFVSCATNLLASGFIGVKAWRYRQAMQDSFMHDKRGMLDKLFRILIETGVAFAIFQLVDAIMAVVYIDTIGVPSSRVLPAGIFDEIVIALAAIYPVLVIIFVQDNKAVIHSGTLGSSSEDPASPRTVVTPNHLDTMRFASSDAHETASSAGEEGKRTGEGSVGEQLREKV